MSEAFQMPGPLVFKLATEHHFTTRKVETRDGTAATLFSLELQDNRAYYILAKVVGRKSDGTQRAFYYRAACVFREGGGAVMLGAPVDLATRESDAAWDCTIDVNLNDVRVRVNAAAGAGTVHWAGMVEYQSAYVHL